MNISTLLMTVADTVEKVDVNPLMVNIIKISIVGFISQKSMKVFGQKDIGETIAFCTCLGIGVDSVRVLCGLYTNFMNSKFVEFMTAIFG